MYHHVAYLREEMLREIMMLRQEISKLRNEIDLLKEKDIKKSSYDIRYEQAMMQDDERSLGGF